MRIKTIKVTNFKSFQDVSVDLGGFNVLIGANASGIDFMQELLKCFCLKMAEQKNKSFRYFTEKHGCKV